MINRAKPAVRAWLLALLIGTLAACSSATAPSVPTAPRVAGKPGAASSSTSTGHSGPKTLQEQLKDYLASALRYAKCLREHGINVTDPDARGNVSFPGGLLKVKTDPTSERVLASCSRTLGTLSPELSEYLTPNISKRELGIERRYARCMRGLGVSGFPDPGPKGFPEGHWDPSSPQAIHAGDVCYGRVYGHPVGTHPKG